MTHNKRHIKKEDFQRYLKNQMTEAERNDFERELQKHPFEAEALEGMQQISPNELKNDLKELKTKLNPVKRKINYRYWAAAATFLLLISAGVIWIQLKDKSPVPEVAQSKTVQQKEETIIPESKPEVQANPETQTNEAKKEVQETDKSKEIPPRAKGNTPLEIMSTPATLTDEKNETAKKQSGGHQKGNNKTFMIQNGVEPATVSEPKLSGDVMNQKMNSVFDNQKIISGKVISLGDSTPLPGATIVEKGTQNTIVSDLEGNFRLKLSDTNDSAFVASFVGMENTEFYPGRDSQIVVGLQPAQVALDEVVAVGNDTKRKSMVTGSVSSVKKINSDANAQPLTGMDNFQKYLEENAVLPEDYPAKRVVIKVTLSINSDGEIINIKNNNDADSAILEKAKELVLQGPEWVPEFKNGKNIESETDLKIVFKK